MERRESFQERRKRQQARRRLLGKLAAVLIGAVFLFGLCKKTADQFLLTGEKKQDSYIGIEDAPPKNNSRLPGRHEKNCFAWVHVK